MFSNAAIDAPLLDASPDAMAEVVGFGHPLLDISCNVDASVLTRYCVEPGSCNLALENQLSIFEDLSQRQNVEFVPGGASMNSIRVLRWLVKKDICTFVGCLGDDEFGCILERALHKAGVKSIFQKHDDKPTGTCACLIVDRERSLLANLGAAVELKLTHMESAPVIAAMKDAQLYYLEGFFMNVVSSPLSSIFVGEHAAQRNKIMAFNLSAPYLCEFFKDKLLAILPFVDILFGSAVDFAALAAAMGWDSSDPQGTVINAAGLPKQNAARSRVVVMTNGEHSTLLAVKGQPVREFQPYRVPEELIVDTNGAGDSFVGGFLSQIVKGRSLEAAITVGHAAAAIVIQHNGCTMPDELPDILSSA